jgi:hypothetical protein
MAWYFCRLQLSNLYSTLVALQLFAAMIAHSGVCDGRPPLACARVRWEGERWQMTFPFASLSNFEDNPLSIIEWINWNQIQSRSIALLVIDVLFVCLSMFGVSIIWWTVGRPITCIQLLSSENWNDTSEYLSGGKTSCSFSPLSPPSGPEETVYIISSCLFQEFVLNYGSLGYDSVQLCHWFLILLLWLVSPIV